MFTGIITEMGLIDRPPAVEKTGWRVRIEAPATARRLSIGGSVAVDGVCLTAVEVGRGWFGVQVVPETGRRTTFGTTLFARGGGLVNLERPLRAGSEVGGHFLQGHVDACVPAIGLTRRDKEAVLAVQLPANLSGLVVEKGSIAVNGVSLTVSQVRRGRSACFTVALVPHTLEATNLGSLEPGEPVNLEVDILGKYVQALLPGRRRGSGRAR
ncbi:MAG TPA: riboflavin synthase [Candidatus Polarisedimenticolia bacterium]|jgi:riboflavin synthase